MEDSPKPILEIDITGPAGATLFWHALEHVAVTHQSEFQASSEETLAHYKDISDERLLAIVGALCVERSIQEILESFGPGFDALEDDPAFTFSLKIKTVRAMKIIPSRILTACDLIRQIRNEFAHHLDKTTLSQLGNDKYLNKVKVQLLAFCPEDHSDKEHGESFQTLIGFTLMALNVYAHHARRLREYLETAAFRHSFREWSKSALVKESTDPR